jgi:hypothetical protein
VIYWAGQWIFLGTNPFASLATASFLPPFADMAETTLFKFNWQVFVEMGVGVFGFRRDGFLCGRDSGSVFGSGRRIGIRGFAAGNHSSGEKEREKKGKYAAFHKIPPTK